MLSENVGINFKQFFFQEIRIWAVVRRPRLVWLSDINKQNGYTAKGKNLKVDIFCKIIHETSMFFARIFMNHRCFLQERS